MKIPRELNVAEARVLGALLEKEQTTPEYYPLTLNALVAACNQRSNRDPVIDFDEADVRAALEGLHEDVLVWPVSGARSERWRQNVDRRWELEAPTKAVMTLLLLRGPQTPGELRGRSSRMYQFTDTAEVEVALELLAEDPEPLVVPCPRRPGQKEARWAHLVCGRPEEADAETGPQEPRPRAAGSPGTALASRVEQLEERVHRLEQALAALSGDTALSKEDCSSGTFGEGSETDRQG